MARGREQHIEHLLRRAAFGAVEEEVTHYAAMPFNAAVDRLLSFERFPDDVDAKIGAPGYVGVTARAAGGFQPATNIDDARQRWLFRMVHCQRPLQEKMALFWHNHFATAYCKVTGAFGAADATRMMAAKPDRGSDRRRAASSSFPEVRASATSAICSSRSRRIRRCWSGSTAAERRGAAAGELRPRADGALHDGRRHFQETDVYAGARVFTGWNLARPSNSDYYAFAYNAGQHDTRRQGFLVPGLPERQQDDSGAQRRAGHAGRHRPHRRARAASGDRPAAGAQALRLLHERSRRAGRGVGGRTCRASITKSDTNIKPVLVRADARAQFHRRAQLVTSAMRGRSSSSSARSRKSAGTASRSNGVTPLVTWGSSSSSRRTSTAGISAAAGSRPAACWRG